MQYGASGGKHRRLSPGQSRAAEVSGSLSDRIRFDSDDYDVSNGVVQSQYVTRRADLVSTSRSRRSILRCARSELFPQAAILSQPWMGVRSAVAHSAEVTGMFSNAPRP